MMKQVFKIQALCVLLFAFVGCEGFLDREVTGYPLEEDFFYTKYQLQAGLNATYNVLQSDAFNDSEWRFGEALGDDVIGTDEGLGSEMGQLVHFRFTNSNTYIKNRWDINYKGIHYANQVIANAHKVELTSDAYTEYQTVREILGQAKFLRALFYFNLARTFGGVPIRPEVESVDSLVIPRSSLEETYAYIEKDLREAACMLEPRYTSADAGKASSGAAVALLMRALMYQATPSVESDKWEQVVELGRFFVEGGSMTIREMLKWDERYDEDWESFKERLWFKDGGDYTYTLDSQLRTLQGMYTYECRDAFGNSICYLDQWYQTGEFCSGSIFEVVFKESGDGTNGDTNEGGYIYDDLFSKDNCRMYADEQIISKIFGTDKRKGATIGHHETTPDMQNTEIGAGRIFSLKWYTPVKDKPTFGGDNAKNRRYLRYADVVLMYAEALNECGKGAEALAQLNGFKTMINNVSIDGRTTSTTSDLYKAGGYGYLRDRIWEERRKEFAFEWERFWDIVRQGRAAEVLQEYSEMRPNKRGLYFRTGVNEIFPIPQTEIDVSNGVLEQNPGY